MTTPPPPAAYEAAAVARMKAHGYYELLDEAPLREAVKISASGHALRATVDAVWAVAVAATRVQVAAEIRAADVDRIADLDGDTARVGLTVAARIAEGTEGSGI